MIVVNILVDTTTNSAHPALPLKQAVVSVQGQTKPIPQVPGPSLDTHSLWISHLQFSVEVSVVPLEMVPVLGLPLGTIRAPLVTVSVVAFAGPRLYVIAVPLVIPGTINPPTLTLFL